MDLGLDSPDNSKGRPSGDVTQLLDHARDGAPEAIEALVEGVYKELRRTAAAMVGREAPGLTLAATDLVHEAFFRLFGQEVLDWKDRRHFFGSAATAMRRILIDHARRKRAGKRIPNEKLVSMESASDAFDFPNLDLLALGRALDRLSEQNPRQAQIVELRFFAGLTEAEVAELLEVSRMTVSRDWKVARLRLLRDMTG
ncbi:MAG: sigma-70 family RNA polymerase sigma factor [Deltaproteobacteria bacterium]|nr:sigma-70 family RNA polymerase sigma factor [Deltaproteobacteria bacterium]